MQPEFFRWNDDSAKLVEADGYIIPGGFSYEDRGRSGMVAARDPVMEVIREQSTKGKPVIGICNGAQVLVESGLIPLSDGLRMSLARNVVAGEATGFLNEWVFITPTCAKDRCATSNWDGPMQLPIAHGEGRFTTKDKDLLTELKTNDQLAFSYCDKEGHVSEDPLVTPNGSVYAVAGICNPEGNVVALMPHPERSKAGDSYFESLRQWIEEKRSYKLKSTNYQLSNSCFDEITTRTAKGTEIFIDTIITNNEERTVEQAARRIVPSLTLKQLKYFAVPKNNPQAVLDSIALFNPNKEIAYIRRGGEFVKWNADAKKEEPTSDLFANAKVLLRRDEPDTGAVTIGGGETGICYVVSGVDAEGIKKPALLEIFANPHASTLEILS